MRFKYRLALHLGLTVAELDRRMSHLELVGWMAYSKLEPFGYHIENWRMAMICACVSNLFLGKGKPARQPAEFMPKDPQPKRNEEEQRQFVDAEVRRIFTAMAKK